MSKIDDLAKRMVELEEELNLVKTTLVDEILGRKMFELVSINWSVLRRMVKSSASDEA